MKYSGSLFRKTRNQKSLTAAAATVDAEDIESGISMESNLKRGCFSGSLFSEREAEDRYILIDALIVLIWFSVWAFLNIIWSIYGKICPDEADAVFFWRSFTCGVIPYILLDVIGLYFYWHKIPAPEILRHAVIDY